MSFHIRPGEIIGIVGESGCDKTLTARSIPGLLPPEVRGDVSPSEVWICGNFPQKKTVPDPEEGLGYGISRTDKFLNPLLKIGPQIGESLGLHDV